MSHGLRKAAWTLAVVPLMGLALAGCAGGGSDGGAPAEQTVAVPQESAPGEATAESTARYDITVLMVCDAVDKALTQIGNPDEASPQQFRSALRKSLNSAFRSSTTPEATIADVKVDLMLNQGCPGLRAKAISGSEVAELSDLAK